MRIETHPRASARAALGDLLGEALASLSAHRTRSRISRAAAIAFALGAVVGAGALLVLAPGGDQMRRALASRVRHTRDLLLDAVFDAEDTVLAARTRARSMISGEAPPEERLVPEPPFG